MEDEATAGGASPEGQPGGQPTEEELRAALEEEMSRVHVGDVVLQSIVSLINLGARRTGSTEQTAGERDLAQAQIAIDAAAALVPAVERIAPEQVPAINDALSQLRLAWVKAGGQESSGSSDQSPSSAAESSPQASSGDAGQGGDQGGDGESRIWVPPGVR